MPRELIQPNPENASIEDLRAAMGPGSKTTGTRCLAIIMLLTGSSREQVCAAVGKKEPAVRQWVKNFNDAGIDGLIDNRPGAPRKIPCERHAELRQALLDPAAAERAAWSATAFHGWLNEQARIECGYDTVRRFIAGQGFTLQRPRPYPDRRDKPEAQLAREQHRARLKELAALPDVDIWYSDESGIEGEPRPYAQYAPKGQRPRVIKNGDHLRLNVIGLVCPRTGEFFAIEASHCDTALFQAFLDEANRCLSPSRRRNIMIVDNASWHHSKRLDWGAFEPMFLPPYSPDLNPIEWLWHAMKQKWFHNCHCKTIDRLIERTDQALLDLIDNPGKVRQTVKGNND
jgi:transposase